MYISIKYERYERLNNTILLFFGSCQNCMSFLILLHKSTRCIYNVTVLAILECLEFKKFFLSPNHGGRQYFPVFLGPSTLKSISPALIIICQYIQCHTQTYFPIIELVWEPYIISLIQVIIFFVFLYRNISKLLFKDFYRSLHNNGKPKAA